MGGETVAIVLLVILVIAAIGVVVWYVLRQNPPTPPGPAPDPGQPVAGNRAIYRSLYENVEGRFRIDNGVVNWVPPSPEIDERSIFAVANQTISFVQSFAQRFELLRIAQGSTVLDIVGGKLAMVPLTSSSYADGFNWIALAADASQVYKYPRTILYRPFEDLSSVVNEEEFIFAAVPLTDSVVLEFDKCTSGSSSYCQSQSFVQYV